MPMERMRTNLNQQCLHRDHTSAVPWDALMYDMHKNQIRCAWVVPIPSLEAQPHSCPERLCAMVHAHQTDVNAHQIVVHRSCPCQASNRNLNHVYTIAVQCDMLMEVMHTCLNPQCQNRTYVEPQTTTSIVSTHVLCHMACLWIECTRISIHNASVVTTHLLCHGTCSRTECTRNSFLCATIVPA